jgi:hypothetical protein
MTFTLPAIMLPAVTVCVGGHGGGDVPTAAE